MTQFVISEFDDIFKYVTLANPSVLMLQSEAKLLLAVQAKLPYELFGIPEESVKELKRYT